MSARGGEEVGATAGTSGTGPGDVERLRRLLGGGSLAWLVARARRRLEQGRPLAGPVTLSTASAEQRAALDRLLGRRARRGSSLTVRWEDLEAVLVTSGTWPAGLADALTAIGGPVVVRAEALAVEREAWARAWTPLDSLASPRLRAWWADELASGLPRRLAVTPEAAGVLAVQLRGVLDRLPAGGVAIGSLSHAATGSAHALDRGPLAALALRAARVVADLAPAPRSAAGDRETWAAVGVVRDELASSALVLGLPVVPGGGASATALAAWSGVAQPAILTLRHLRLDPPVWAPPGRGHGGGAGVVWSCENPVVLAAVADAARRRDVPSSPVVCTSGQPSVAALAVLRGLRAAGWTVRHHGDFDPDGLRITERLVQEVGARPWQMGAADYDAAVAAGGGRPAAVIGASVVGASWDAGLGPAMLASGEVVEEEAVLDLLVGDVFG